MFNKKYKRISIIGLPGSGKSTFAIALGKKLKIPVEHLDGYVFDGSHKRDKNEFISILNKILEKESWIIEGCSTSTFELRFQRSDVVFYFKLPRLLCLHRILKRIFTFNSEILKTGCLVGINWALIKYIWQFDKKQRENIDDLLKKFPEIEFIEFNNTRDIQNLLNKI